MNVNVICTLLLIYSLTATSFAADNPLLEDVARVCDQFCVVRPEKQCGTTPPPPPPTKKPLPAPDIYVPMDSIDGPTTGASGTEAKVMGWPKPFVASGVFNGSIYLPNTQTLDDKFIDLGYMRQQCVDNLDLCTNGLTVSLWFWHEYIYQWPCIISASQWQIHTHTKDRQTNEPYVHFFKEPNKRYSLGGHYNTSVTNNQWHHVAFVYRSYYDMKFFVDGVLNSEVPTFNRRMHIAPKNVQVGCHINGNCMRGKFDDLKIWEQALSDEDIKTIYNEKNSSIEP